ncbi:HEAT repeat domain-containing protein, partial [Halobium palmae]
MTGSAALGELVVRRPDLLVSHVERLIEAVRATELDREIPNFEVVDDPVTRQTLREHEEGERERRVSARRTLLDVVVAVIEEAPEAT